jgi:predicted membrane protein
MKTITKMLIICKIIFTTTLALYMSTKIPIVKEGHQNDLNRSHYYYYYKNGKNYKKYNKPEIEEKHKNSEKMRENYIDKNDYYRDIERLNNLNIEKRDEIKLKFRNERNIHLDYDRND